MKNLKLVIILVIIFVLGVSGIYYIYDLNINKKSETSASPSPQANFPSSSGSPSPSSSATPVGSVAGTKPNNQPLTGNDYELAGASFKLTRPNENEKVSSPVKLQGFIQGPLTITVSVKDTDSTLASVDIKCDSSDICYFETSLEFAQPKSTSGSIAISTPQEQKTVNIVF